MDFNQARHQFSYHRHKPNISLSLWLLPKLRIYQGHILPYPHKKYYFSFVMIHPQPGELVRSHCCWC